jgi:hypothetical protein
MKSLSALFDLERSELLRAWRRLLHGIGIPQERRDAHTRLRGDALLDRLYELAKDHPTPEGVSEICGKPENRTRTEPSRLPA